MSHNLRPLVLALSAVGVGGLAVAPAAAQQAQQPQKIEKIEVTGSNIKRVDAETAAPVLTITAAEIKASGAVSVGELLRNISAASGGSVEDLDSGTGFASGASSVSLRGLGSQATLILLNSRRIAPAAYADPNTGQSTVFNLNTIPAAAIERIEVLKDGASAIYGSEAMAGVINIILRKDYTGAEAGVSYSLNHDREFGNRQIYGILGFGNLAKDRYNGYLIFDNGKRDAVSINDAHDVAESELTRIFSRNSPALSSLSYPGNYFRENRPGSGVYTTFVNRDARCPQNLVLANGRCGHNFDAVLNSVSKQDRNTVMGRLTFEVSPDLQLWTDFGFSRVENEYINTVRSVANTGTIWFAQDGRRNLFQFILPVGHPDNPNAFPVAVSYRFSDVGPLVRKVKTDTSRVVVGAKGSLAGWDWESAFLFSKTERDSKSNGFLYFPAITEAIRNLSYRPFGNNSAETLARISPQVVETGETKNTSLDVKASRELAELAGGAMALAVGLETRKEELAVNPDPRVVAGDFVGLGGSQARGDRKVTSVFGELSLPWLKSLEAQLALRYDHYSDYGNSTTPKVGVKWTPVSALAFRGTYAKGFRAPSLSQIGNSNVQSFNTGLSDPIRCPVTGAPEDCNFTGSSLIRANPNLQPEKSDGFTLGMVFSPNSDLNLAIDFYRISRTNEVDRLSAQTMINNELRFPGAVLRNQNPDSWLPGVPNSGPIQSTIRQFFNLGRTVTRGVEFDGNVTKSLGSMGKLKASFGANYLISYKNKVRADDSYVSWAGGYGPAGELPRFRGNVATTWTYGDFSVLGRVNYVSGWAYLNADATCGSSNLAYRTTYNCRIKAWTTLDMRVTYSGVKNLELGMSVRNLQNKAAPLDPDNVSLGYNPTFHNPYGRYFNVSANYKFL